MGFGTRPARWLLAPATLAAVLLSSAGVAAPSKTFAIERPQTLNGHPVGGQLPIVTLRIGTDSYRFLFDTGASEVVVNDSIARQLGLLDITPSKGSDSGGVAVKGRYVAGFDLATPDGMLLRHFDRVLTMPLGPLDTLGLAGVIGPQALAKDGCVHVDFGGGVATMARADAAACRPSARASVEAAPGWRSDGRPHLMLRVGEGSVAVPFLVDSGAWRTSIPASAATALPRLRTAQSRGVGGKIVTAEIVGPVSLTIGCIGRTLAEAALIPDRPAGVLGFDLLSRMTLIVHADGGFSIGD
ncbi:aspartyl protease family protein [Sphingomonas sp. MMS24-J45]|uniref:aspartyl protease family protein n=1 Tax=Sphingomonas sp. MMS24-J45 TaxID=3238806 RepID=UPI00384B8C7A